MAGSLSPRHRATQVRALPVQGEEALGDARDVELALADDLDVTDFEVADHARGTLPPNAPRRFGVKKLMKPMLHWPSTARTAPQPTQRNHRRRRIVPFCSPSSSSSSRLAFLFGRNEQPQLLGRLSHSYLGSL